MATKRASKTRKPPKRRVGRPTDYRPEYCEAVVAHAAKTGKSLTAFAGSIGVDRSTLTRWAQEHREFRTAIGVAKAKRADRLETELLALTNGPAITARLLALKNCAAEDWREQHDVRMGGLPDAPPIETVSLTPEEAYLRMLGAGKGGR